MERAEIFDWWEGARLSVQTECLAERAKLLERAEAGVESAFRDASVLQYFRRNGSLRSNLAHIRRQLTSDVRIFNKRLARTLEVSFAASVATIAGDTDEVPMRSLKWVGLLRGGTTVGSFGLAAGATSVASTAGTAFFIIPTVTFSWPVFLVAGIGAITLSLSSNRASRLAKDRMQLMICRHIRAALDQNLIGADGFAAPNSTADVFLGQINQHRKARLDALSGNF